jgi:deazaflavin-dependent oxidoreductase (nitroreductase family)
MTKGTALRGRPTGLLRLFMRAPLWLYRLRLGWLFGERLLLLSHTGRVSGRPRQVVIEVLRHDRAADAYIVASGWGERADWYRNLLRTPAVSLVVGRRRIAALARRLPPEEAARELGDYARRHPAAFRSLSRLMLGAPLAGAPEECERLARAVPVIALQVRAAGPGEG